MLLLLFSSQFAGKLVQSLGSRLVVRRRALSDGSSAMAPAGERREGVRRKSAVRNLFTSAIGPGRELARRLAHRPRLGQFGVRTRDTCSAGAAESARDSPAYRANSSNESGPRLAPT